MRILLVKPYVRLNSVLGLERFQRLEPLELGYVAAAIPAEHECRVLDLRLSRNPGRVFARTLSKFKPDLVGFTAYSHESGIMKTLAAEVRRLLPRAKVLVGGHHATVAAADCNCPEIDYIIRGEGCAPFRELVAALALGQEPVPSESLVLSGDRFDATAASVWPRWPDPASMPTPRRDLWNYRDYYCVWPTEHPKNWQVLFPRVAMVRSSYGCKMKCTFCIVPFLCNGEHRPRPVDAVVDELASIHADHIYFADDENFINEAHGYALAEAIVKRGIKKRYFAWTRSTTVLRSPDLLRRWREIGLDAAFLGFEYPTDEQLRDAKKGASVAANEKAQSMLREMGIACHIGFMVKPQDTAADFQRLRDYVSKIEPAQFSFNVYTPSPGTPNYEIARPQMWVDDPYRLHDCTHPLTPTKLPLRKFFEEYASLYAHGSKRNPLRVKHHPIRPWELLKVLLAEKRYSSTFRNNHADYPSQLWDWPGSGESAPVPVQSAD